MKISLAIEVTFVSNTLKTKEVPKWLQSSTFHDMTTILFRSLRSGIVMASLSQARNNSSNAMVMSECE